MLPRKSLRHFFSMKTRKDQRYLALDVGKVRIGLAFGEADAKVAFPEGTYLRAQGQAEKHILDTVDTRRVTTLVVGLPLDEKGGMTAEATDIVRFCRRLERRSKVNIIYVDEYLSSAEAVELLKEAGHTVNSPKYPGKRGIVDSSAATIILQRYLDGSVTAVSPELLAG